MHENENVLHTENASGNAVIAALALEVGKPRTVKFAPRERAFVLVPDGNGKCTLEYISAPEVPDRATGSYTFDTIDSFGRFVSAQKSLHSVVYARRGAMPGQGKSAEALSLVTALAVLNEHDKDAPAFRDYRANLAPPCSDSLAKWFASNGKRFEGNEEFAEFLEDHFEEIVEPAGATIMELALNFSVKADVAFSNPVNLQDGSTKLTVMKTIVGGGNAPSGNVVIPKRFLIEIPILRGDPKKYKFEAHFRFRVGGSGGVTIWYQLIRPEVVLDLFFKETVEKIAADTGLPVLVGDAGFNL